ncbi:MULTISPECIES: ABC transporter ATP-binding protein [Brachymonas]|uniref:ABC transporter ATP-binding protein n=1 Tax=Brachymonas TaxID=28219 RepID=UPI002E78EF7E|nr:ABC transporter ATP-binding protein [Brachymonas sp. J145]MEE1653937.1 ABC transporter ATP-binding protein [Brachymonas sp. J145]
MSAISIQSLTKTYPRRGNAPAVHALDNVSFDIQHGEFFGLLGPNGAGKTTLISILAGLAHASKGTIRVHGHDVRANYIEARRHLGIVPQELVFDPFFTVREALRFQSGYFGMRNNDAWIDELLHSLGLADKAQSNMRQLSGGMKRRVLVAQALVHKPPVIVLDEPTAGVDVELRQTLWKFVSELNRQGHTVLLTTHYLEEAEALCHRIAMLKQGKLLALEKTSTLLAGASASVLHFKTDSPLPPAVAAKARVTGRMVELPAQSPDEIEHYLGAMRTAGVRVEDIEIRKADLEDVFITLMQGKGGEVRA